MPANNPEANEAIKYLLGVIGTVAGSYIVFIVKSIGQDIKQLKELLMTHVDVIKGDIVHLREDIADLYEKGRDNETKIAELRVNFNNLKKDHDRRHQHD